jgi:hypothetical protein
MIEITGHEYRAVRCIGFTISVLIVRVTFQPQCPGGAFADRVGLRFLKSWSQVIFSDHSRAKSRRFKNTENEGLLVDSDRDPSAFCSIELQDRDKIRL